MDRVLALHHSLCLEILPPCDPSQPIYKRETLEVHHIDFTMSTTSKTPKFPPSLSSRLGGATLEVPPSYY